METSFTTIIGVLAGGAVTAGQIAAGASAIALALGFAFALLNVFTPFPFVRVVVGAYVEWMRNVPALAHLFLLYFGLASVGIRFSPKTAAVLGLGLVGAAVLCDVFAAGMRAIHAGQREAALAVGLSPLQTLRFILVPQMLRFTLPALGNYVSQLIKDTSIASAIAAPEIMFYARNLVTSTFETPMIYTGAMLMFACIVLPTSWLFVRLERRLECRR